MSRSAAFQGGDVTLSPSLGSALGQGARLVEGDGIDLRQPLQRGAPLDQHAQPRQPCRRRQNGRGRRQHQTTGAGHDQHGQCGHDVDRRGRPFPEPAPRSPGVGRQEHQQGRRQHGGKEPPGEPIGRPFQGGLVSLGLGQELDHLAHGRLAANLLDPDFEPTELVDRPREDRVSGALVDRQALAREDGLIDGGPAPEHRSVGRDPLSRPDHQHVAGHDRVGRDLRLLAIPEQPSRSRPILQQLLDRPLRPPEGERLQTLAQQGDEDDLGGHEVFAGQAGRHAGDRQRDVGADPPLQESQAERDRRPALRR